MDLPAEDTQPAPWSAKQPSCISQCGCGRWLCAWQVRVDLLAEGVQPALWSAEQPNLYILVLSLLGRDGAHIESESCQARRRTHKNGTEDSRLSAAQSAT